MTAERRNYKDLLENFDTVYTKLDRNSSIFDSCGIKIVCSDKLSSEKGIVHGFTTRIGGVSPEPFDTLNFSFSRADSTENILKNFERLANAYSLDKDSFLIVNYEHGSNIIRVDRSDCGRGITREPLPFGDGIITNDSNVTLLTCHADCGAIFLYDRENRAIGLAHSGWKGTYKRIGQRLVESMNKEFGSEPEALVAALGPSICFDCFEVDKSLGEDFEQEFSYKGLVKSGREGKAFIDLEAALVIQLLEAGIEKRNISIMHRCTFENRELFFSYRRDGLETGGMVSFLKLNN